MPKLDLIGSGNAFLPNGRLHSLSLIDSSILIDVPPTALLSLRKIGVSPSDVHTIFITHLHGDHVFGFPFLILERKWISDREDIAPLRVIGAPGVREMLCELCELAYPESMTERLEEIEWIEDDTGMFDEWQWERFAVLHEDSVDPYGYLLKHKDGNTLLHSGDSGPCQAIEERIRDVDIAVVEMGVPDWVDTDMHHSPSDIIALAQRNPDIRIIVTHTFIDEEMNGVEPIIDCELPVLGSNVIHGSDGMTFEW